MKRKKNINLNNGWHNWKDSGLLTLKEANKLYQEKMKDKNVMEVYYILIGKNKKAIIKWGEYKKSQ